MASRPFAVQVSEGWEVGFPPLVDGALAAPAWLYGLGLALRQRLNRSRGPRRVAEPVVAIGNLTVGGTGKTPLVALAVRTLVGLGASPAVVSRGYGRRGCPVRVVSDGVRVSETARESGDEPLALARQLTGIPVVVGGDRHAAACVAIDQLGATAIVLDDGFQQTTLATDLRVVVAPAVRPWGNGHLLPRGPLRELPGALGRAHLLVVTHASGRTEHRAEAADVAERVGCPVAHARYVVHSIVDAADGSPVDRALLAGAPVASMCAIARPWRFRETLAALGARTVMEAVAGDHHWYQTSELEAIALAARQAGATWLATTEKDWVRIGPWQPEGLRVAVIGVRLELSAGHALWHGLLEQVWVRR